MGSCSGRRPQVHLMHICIERCRRVKSAVAFTRSIAASMMLQPSNVVVRLVHVKAHAPTHKIEAGRTRPVRGAIGTTNTRHAMAVAWPTDYSS